MSTGALNDKYSNFVPEEGESKYVEYDGEFSGWGIFGSNSGFCYALFGSKAEADQQLKDQYK